MGGRIGLAPPLSIWLSICLSLFLEVPISLSYPFVILPDLCLALLPVKWTQMYMSLMTFHMISKEDVHVSGY